MRVKDINLKKKYILMAIALLAFIIVGGVSTVIFFGNEFIINITSRWQLPDLEMPKNPGVVLIVAPHPDDEALSSFHFARELKEQGAKVKLLLITNGDGFIDAAKMYYKKLRLSPAECRDYALMRQQESINAVAKMGIEESDIIFLGFPDGGMDAMLRENWLAGSPYQNPYTQYDKSAYANAFKRDVPYAGESFTDLLSDVLLDINPDTVIMPHPNDHHPDHRAVNAFVQLSIAQAGLEDVQTLLYLVHHGGWPTPWVRDARLHLVPPAVFRHIDTQWNALEMSDSQTEEKGQTIGVYRSQTMALALLMYAFERKNELFGTIKPIALQAGMADVDDAAHRRYIVIHDPPDDNISQYRFPAADINRVHALIPENGGINLLLQTMAKDTVTQEWRILCFYLQGRDIERVEIDIDGKASNVYRNGVPEGDKGIQVQYGANSVDIYLPREVLKKSDRYFVTVSAYHKGKLADPTALRELLVNGAEAGE